ncbi:hypothetical protein BHM03_00014778 [Ensete ventricosum]|uniref:KNOX1 domain-containing protein n=1 Tax=Ensete ventricosum TaxID=4639 RepID=A0A445MEA9_ENSVE|nr:hypothetical protein BHM03_00014778 [Ensete ventricosum]
MFNGCDAFSRIKKSQPAAGPTAATHVSRSHWTAALRRWSTRLRGATRPAGDRGRVFQVWPIASTSPSAPVPVPVPASPGFPSPPLPSSARLFSSLPLDLICFAWRRRLESGIRGGGAMAFHNHLSHELTLPEYAEQQLGGDSQAVLRTAMDQLAAPPPDTAASKDGKRFQRLMADAAATAGKPSMAGAGGPTWLNSAILRQQGHHYADGSFLHLQTSADSSASPVAAGGGGGGAGHWLPRPPILRRSGSEDEVPVSSDSAMAAAISAEPGGGRGHSGGEFGEAEALAQGSGGGGQAGEGTWQNARYKAEILAHPLYEQLLSAHVACLRIATPVDQLPRIDAQLAQSQQVVSKYSVLGGGGSQMLGDDKELDQFMIVYSAKIKGGELFRPNTISDRKTGV